MTNLILILLSIPLLESFATNQDPEINWNATQIIQNYGYIAEEHFIETEDGYILCLIRFRNPSFSNEGLRGVVFMQHGLLDSAHTWIMNFRNQSLGFILADKGYDVWLGNSRGSTYSKRHKWYSPSSARYWRFSWDEMAKYDLPASLYHTMNVTGSEKINYVGHSQGCQIALAQFSRDKELESRIKVFIALAPVAFLGNLESPLRYIAPLSHFLQFFGVKEFLPSTGLMKFLAKVVCGHKPSSVFCSNIIFLLVGFDSKNLNETRLPVYVGHAPAGTSARNLVHYCQSIQSDRFQQYDHGLVWNWIIYGQSTPPLYNLTNIRLPMVIFNGGGDWLAVPRDIDDLLTAVAGNVIARIYVPDYNHLDFVWGINSASLIYPSVIQQLAAFNP